MDSMEHGGAPAPRRLEPLEPLKSLFEAKDWNALRRVLDGCAVWAFDRPLTAGAMIDALEELLGAAGNVKLLVLAVSKREAPGDEEAATFRCCAMWDEPDSWDAHEFDFDLHLSFRNEGEGARKALYLGLTGNAYY